MKIAFIFAFVLVCGLAFCREESNDREDKTVVADPYRHCKSTTRTNNST